MRERAKTFLEEAESLLARGKYDIACFNAEQAAQLYLKALTLRLLGYIPRARRAREILGMISKALKEMGREDLKRRVEDLVENARRDLRELEDAYVGSRYLLRTYDREDAVRCIEVAKKVFEICRGIEDEISGRFNR